MPDRIAGLRFDFSVLSKEQMTEMARRTRSALRGSCRLRFPNWSSLLLFSSDFTAAIYPARGKQTILIVSLHLACRHLCFPGTSDMAFVYTMDGPLDWETENIYSPGPRTRYMDALPPETILNILREVDVQTLVLIKQCKIEFALSGLLEPPPQSLSKANQLAAIRTYERAWRSLEWDRWLSIDPFNHSHTFVVMGNIIGQQSHRSNTIWFTRIPSRRLGTAVEHWSVDIEPEIDVLEFRMDPDQDLLMIGEQVRVGSDPDAGVKVHLRSLKTGLAHPQAHVTPYTIHVEHAAPHQMHCEPQILGDQIGVLWYDEGGFWKGQVSVFNWKTGTKRIEIVEHDIHSIAFLDEDHILLAHPCFRDIEGAVILVYDMRNHTAERTSVEQETFRCALLLPLVFEWFRIDDVYVRSDSAHINTHSLPFPRRRTQIDTVVSISMSCSSTLDGEESFDSYGDKQKTLVIYSPASVLRRGIAQVAPGTVVPWEAWGPPSTCLAMGGARSDGSNGLFLISGMRALQLSNIHGFDTMRVFDFDPARLSKTICEWQVEKRRQALTGHSMLGSDGWERLRFHVGSVVPNGYWYEAGYRGTIPFFHRAVPLPDELKGKGKKANWYLTDDAVVLQIWQKPEDNADAERDGSRKKLYIFMLLHPNLKGPPAVALGHCVRSSLISVALCEWPELALTVRQQAFKYCRSWNNNEHSDTILEIFKNLDIETLLTCKYVCRLWNKLIKGDLSLQYEVEFGLSGLATPLPHKLSSFQKLQVLRQHQNAWRELKWDHWIATPTKPPEDGTRDSLKIVLASDVFSQKGVQDDDILFTRIPSRRLMTAIEHWTIRPETPCHTWTLDPAQDLLVLFEKIDETSGPDLLLILHFCSLKTGAVHPDAYASTLALPITASESPHDIHCEIQILGDQVCAMWMDDTSSDWETPLVAVWNWKTGKKRIDLRSGLCRIFSAAFLDEDYILVGSVQFGPNSEQVVLVYDMRTHTDQRTSLNNETHDCVLKLPTRFSPVDELAVCVRSDSMHMASSSPAFPRRGRQVDSMISISMPCNFLSHEDDGEAVAAENNEEPIYIRRALRIYIPASRLRKLLLEVWIQGWEFDWETWGPSDTYAEIHKVCWADDHADFICGMRVAQASKNNLRSLVVRDFDPARVAKAISDSESKKGSSAGKIVLGSRIPKGFRTAGGIETHLPCYEKSVPLPKGIEKLRLVNDPHWLITDDAIIIIGEKRIVQRRDVVRGKFLKQIDLYKHARISSEILHLLASSVAQKSVVSTPLWVQLHHAFALGQQFGLTEPYRTNSHQYSLPMHGSNLQLPCQIPCPERCAVGADGPRPTSASQMTPGRAAPALSIHTENLSASQCMIGRYGSGYILALPQEHSRNIPAYLLVLTLFSFSWYWLPGTSPSRSLIRSIFLDKSTCLASSSALKIVDMYLSPLVLVLGLAIRVSTAPINHAEGSVNPDITSSAFAGNVPVVLANDVKLSEAAKTSSLAARMSKRAWTTSVRRDDPNQQGVGDAGSQGVGDAGSQGVGNGGSGQGVGKRSPSGRLFQTRQDDPNQQGVAEATPESQGLGFQNASSPAQVSQNTTDALNSIFADLKAAFADIKAGKNKSNSTNSTTNTLLDHAGVHLGEFVGFRR
ncbi:hypothetical protein EVG20_g1418 [Dentipellis fragilis]|uniref:F-box domain-containing protein n=1 Tax=Dentipellis fragilis TaxID=205917 RepID=A0A4Y9ZCP0_9AGAM|nr:hypothetical protein EVG20_g1418 [Dentipellis fragilis]